MNMKDTAKAATSGHIFHRYDNELQALIGLVGEMGELAKEQIRDAGKAIKKGDVDRARGVLERERRIDELDDAIDEEIHRLLALRAPMARDLRVLLTVNRLGSYLERIGDHARDMANLALREWQNTSTRWSG